MPRFFDTNRNANTMFFFFFGQILELIKFSKKKEKRTNITFKLNLLTTFLLYDNPDRFFFFHETFIYFSFKLSIIMNLKSTLLDLF